MHGWAVGSIAPGRTNRVTKWERVIFRDLVCKIAHNGRLQTCGHPTFRRNNSPYREIMQELAA